MIPIHKRSKKALVQWEEYQKRRATPDELVTWFKGKDVNIGIVTGPISNLAAIDLDGPAGIEEGRRLGLYSPATVFSGVGKHLWYKWAAGIQNSASKIAPKIDVRGEGGYLCAPPSLHSNGRRYRFLSHAFNVDYLPPFPVKLLQKKIEPVVKMPQENWITEALEDMKNGHVHNTLIRILGRFRYHNFSIDDTYSLLAPYAFEEGKPMEGLRSKIEEFWGRYEAGGTTSAGLLRDMASESRSIADFLDREILTEWLCKPFFAKQSLSFIVGLPESLKSWLAIELSIALSTGTCWLGQYQTSPSKVLFIDQERALPETQRRFKALLAEKGLNKKDLAGNLFVDCSSHRKIDMDVSYEAFKKEIERVKPDVIIVDSWITFHTKSDNDRTEIQKVLDRLKTLREAYGCSFIFINHENKAAYQDAVEHQEPSAGRMSGTIGIVAAAESILTVKKTDSFSSNVYQTKNSLAAPAEPFSVQISDTPRGIKVEGIR